MLFINSWLTSGDYLMADRIFELTPVYVDEMLAQPEHGNIYISHEYKLAIHLCACGCGIKTVTPLAEEEWTLTGTDEVTLRPSIGNFIGETPYHAHYLITNNKVEWC